MSCQDCQCNKKVDQTLSGETAKLTISNQRQSECTCDDQCQTRQPTAAPSNSNLSSGCSCRPRPPPSGRNCRCCPCSSCCACCSCCAPRRGICVGNNAAEVATTGLGSCGCKDTEAKPKVEAAACSGCTSCGANKEEAVMKRGCDACGCDKCV